MHAVSGLADYGRPSLCHQATCAYKRLAPGNILLQEIRLSNAISLPAEAANTLLLGVHAVVLTGSVNRTLRAWAVVVMLSAPPCLHLRAQLCKLILRQDLAEPVLVLLMERQKAALLVQDLLADRGRALRVELKVVVVALQLTVEIPQMTANLTSLLLAIHKKRFQLLLLDSGQTDQLRMKPGGRRRLGR
jgi:hypothetical protein